jgi:hypothetical protein
VRMAPGQGLVPEIWCPGGTRAPETVATAIVTAVWLDVVVVVQVDMMCWLVFGPAGRGCGRGRGQGGLEEGRQALLTEGQIERRRRGKRSGPDREAAPPGHDAA